MSGWKPTPKHKPPHEGYILAAEFEVYGGLGEDWGYWRYYIAYWDKDASCFRDVSNTKGRVKPEHWQLIMSPGKPRTRIRSAKHGQLSARYESSGRSEWVKDDADKSPDTHVRETAR